MKKIFILLTVTTLGTACSIEPVKPWQRQYLAQPEMNWAGGMVEQSVIRTHTYTSKEAASGGSGIGGGGCGCN